MNRFWSLVPAPARSRRRTVAVIVLAVIAPLLVLLALLPHRSVERVSAAVVNLDAPLDADGAPVAVGKLLTENLLTGDDGVTWTLTDAATADAGLADGGFQAVVTIPAEFSKDVATIGSDAPTVAQLQVRTSTRHGYVEGTVADALAAGLPRGVAAELTSGYVAGTLSAFADLSEALGQASSGARDLTAGIQGAGEGAGAIEAGASDLASGIGEIARILDALPEGARDLGALSAAASADTAALAVSLAEEALVAEELALAQDVGVIGLDEIAALIALDPAQPAGALVDEIEALRQGAAGIAARMQTQAGALAGHSLDAAAVALGTGVVADVAAPVADGLGLLASAEAAAGEGARELAGGVGDLRAGLGELATGSGALASGLDTAAADIPSYTSDQQRTIAGVVADPIGVETASSGGPTTARAAAVAALVPVALWLGALAASLVVAPFSRAALSTSASARRIAGQAALVAVAVGVVQAVLVWIGVAVLGVAAERIAVAFGLTVAMSVCFALVHQALCGLLGRAGLVVSVIALGVQVVAAGTLGPVLAGSIAAGPLALLPLSTGLQGTQALLGGSLHAVLQSAIGLLLWAGVAALGAVAAVARARASVAPAAA
ncbi:hypothetical protein RYJ27_03855 [Microbacterium limosum]|uniref:ABC-2 family transporter protein n=1 Tax=Microbacterium limosum TaxID=3079935 RepID=A0AAU0MK63_9MICO|nr:hypothetical protein [Microbacterium sp. Y20]WOQ70355.1 hypothetical protein RYJ27_03855 [Microbacterium sp. Y20]